MWAVVEILKVLFLGQTKTDTSHCYTLAFFFFFFLISNCETCRNDLSNHIYKAHCRNYCRCTCARGYQRSWLAPIVALKASLYSSTMCWNPHNPARRDRNRMIFFFSFFCQLSVSATWTCSLHMDFVCCYIVVFVWMKLLFSVGHECTA